MYAKKITPAARSTPLHPKAPNSPWLGGTNGCQFAGFTNWKPKPITRKTIATLTKTMMLLKRADSRMPITSSVVMTATRKTAGRLISAPVGTRVCVPTTENGAFTRCVGS